MPNWLIYDPKAPYILGSCESCRSDGRIVHQFTFDASGNIRPRLCWECFQNSLACRGMLPAERLTVANDYEKAERKWANATRKQDQESGPDLALDWLVIQMPELFGVGHE